jgi:uncharacterized surface protein with fasciclin (FAS1) repeats
MKQRGLMATTAFFAFCAVFAPMSARSNNPGAESAIANYSDVSLFYAALLNTGVLNELDPNMHYTIFAPTNEAFANIQPNVYPCFYSTSCRAQVADVLRDHIVAGRWSLEDLTKEGEVPTLGRYRVYAGSPYVGNYAIANNTVLSGAEIRGNMIYRIDGVILSNDQLASFRTMPPLASAVTREKTVTTYRAPAAYLVPGGGYPAGVTETVTQKTYVVPSAAAPGTVTYQDDRDSSDDSDTTTTVTRTITNRP